ncbi:DUF3304 domain-containing protein [Cupriavidus sp. SK-4]|uniref:DUF3304 domain-containing protein n=1 Tax=Cupriavidus sp. SK-4 TaxID=574750 RepID=UPI000A06230F|nr:DUF3304 domain-containing protein [Cupriavidus sp. SK-4]
MLRRRSLIFACLISVLLSACASGGGLSTRDDDKSYINASLGAVTHPSQYLYGFTINGAFGANASAYGAAGAGTCCVRLPRAYRPGLTVDVKYDLTLDDGSRHNWKIKKGVPVEPYTEPGDVYAHFFPNDVIRVVVSNPGPRSSLHPIPYPVRPSEQRSGEKR